MQFPSKETLKKYLPSSSGFMVIAFLLFIFGPFFVLYGNFLHYEHSFVSGNSPNPLMYDSLLACANYLISETNSKKVIELFTTILFAMFAGASIKSGLSWSAAFLVVFFLLTIVAVDFFKAQFLLVNFSTEDDNLGQVTRVSYQNLLDQAFLLAKADHKVFFDSLTQAVDQIAAFSIYGIGIIFGVVTAKTKFAPKDAETIVETTKVAPLQKAPFTNEEHSKGGLPK